MRCSGQMAPHSSQSDHGSDELVEDRSLRATHAPCLVRGGGGFTTVLQRTKCVYGSTNMLGQWDRQDPALATPRAAPPRLVPLGPPRPARPPTWSPPLSATAPAPRGGRSAATAVRAAVRSRRAGRRHRAKSSWPTAPACVGDTPLRQPPPRGARLDGRPPLPPLSFSTHSLLVTASADAVYVAPVAGRESPPPRVGRRTARRRRRCPRDPGGPAPDDTCKFARYVLF